MKLLNVALVAGVAVCAACSSSSDPKVEVCLVPTTTAELERVEGTYNFAVETNCDYTVTSAAEWITIGDSHIADGSKDHFKVSYTVTTNNTYESRVGVITVAFADELVTKKTFTVTQKGAEVPTASVEPDTTSIDYTEQNLRINVATNCESYTVVIPEDATWLTEYKHTTSVITLLAEPFDILSDSTRTATIAVNFVTSTNETITREFVVNQKARLQITPNDLLGTWKTTAPTGFTLYAVYEEGGIYKQGLDLATLSEGSYECNYTDETKTSFTMSLLGTTPLQTYEVSYDFVANKMNLTRDGFTISWDYVEVGDTLY